MPLRRVIGAVAAMALSIGLAHAQVSVTTQRYDAARTGQNLAETTLNASNVGPETFGKLFTRAVDDQIYAQPLYVPRVAVPRAGVRNVVYVATVNNSVYAFDADDPRAAAPLWHVNFNDPARGVRPVANTDVGQKCGTYRDFSGNIGIVGTPVIDEATRTIYVVARTKERDRFVQRLHALDIASGARRPGSPVVIEATVPGTGEGSVNGLLSFDPRIQNQRAALTLANGTIYVAWASHCETGPYHGWIMGYNPGTLAQTFAVALTPDGVGGGIWQSGTGPSVDEEGNLYVTVDSGSSTAKAGGRDFGHSFLKLGPTGQVLDWFTPHPHEGHGEVDLGPGGVLLVPGTKLIAGGGKQGILYVLDRRDLGRFAEDGHDRIVQSFQVAGDHFHFHGTPVYWNGPDGPLVYTWCEADFGKAFKVVDGNRLVDVPYMQTVVPANDGMPGGMMAISADGSRPGTGILWSALAQTGDANQIVRPGILRAFDASDLTRELWNSKQNAERDDFGRFAKFNTPTVANGRVYLATFSNQLVVYGLLPAEAGARPTADAGPARTIALDDALALAGAAGDDGLPAALTTRWVPVTGPGRVTIANPEALATTARFSATGTYVLRLTASDGAVATDSDVTVHVLAAGAVVGRGTGLSVEYFDNADLTGERVARVDSEVDFFWGPDGPAPGIAGDTFSARWTGQVQAQFNETYTFTTLSDDGVRMWIGDRLLIDNWGPHAQTNDSATIDLVKGHRYDVRIEYWERTQNAVMTLEWSSPSTPRATVPRLQLYPAAVRAERADTPGGFLSRAGVWFLLDESAAGAAAATFAFGAAGAQIPLAGDWDGDGVDTVGLYDPATGLFSLKNSNGAGAADAVFVIASGAGRRLPVAGDWDGDGRDSVGVYDPVAGTFHLKNANAAGPADAVFAFGARRAGATPVAGDWDGDGRDSVGLYVGSTGTFELRNVNAAGRADWSFAFGPAGASPVAGDWDGDGVETVGVHLPSRGAWLLARENAAGAPLLRFEAGPRGARPVAGRW